MSKTGYKISDRVKHTKFGTFGKVLDIEPDRGLYVFWDNGTSAYYGEWDLPLYMISRA